MDTALRLHLMDMLAKLRPVIVMANRHGVPSRAAARLRAAAFEIEDALDPGAAERRNEQDRKQGEEDMACVFHASWAPVPGDRGRAFHASWAG